MKHTTAVLFFGLGLLAVGLIGNAVWPDAPDEFIFGCLVGVAALAVAVWGAASR